MTRILIVVDLIVGSVGFSAFVNWYDTGLWSTDDVVPVAMTAIVLAGIALWIAPPTRPWRISALFWIAASTVILVVSFSIGTSLRYGLISVVLLTAVYLAMGVPFGIAFGLLNSALLRLAEPRS